MVRDFLLKVLLAPFAILFGIGVAFKNILYRVGLLKGLRFSVPVISVGNLTVGGAGKTPHTEYLIRLLKEYITVSTLSRGYGRNTKGYLHVHTGNSAEQVGDEPLQYKRKFPEITVAVCESRSLGIPKLIQHNPHVQAILLDDAYQHRSVEPALNILLTEHDHLFTKDFLLPVGRLREWRSAYRRADRIIVTKCPHDLSAEEAEKIKKEINPKPNQKIFFSIYNYHHPYYIFNPSQRILLEEDVDVLLVCAIARANYLLEYLHSKVASVKILQYEDHHKFSSYELSQMKKHFDLMESKKKVILTTEKDAMRLELHRPFILENRLPFFSLPIEVDFLLGGKQAFDEDLKEFLLDFKS